MKLEQSFTVAAPVDQVWAALVDVERIAPCLPGAEITGRDDSGGYEGTFSVKLGPTTAAYRGSLRMESVDEAARTATMSAKGTDKRGQGGASATIVSTMREEGGETNVDVLTDFHITGRLARFGRSGMIEDISRRLMRDFAECLQSTLGAPPAGVSPVPPDDAGAEIAVAPAGVQGEGAAASGWLGEAADATGAPTPPVRAGDVPAEAAGGASPSSDPSAAGTLGVPAPSEPGRQAPGTTGGAAGPEGVPDGAGAGAAPDPAEAAIASAGGAAAEAATAGSAPPGADDLAAGPAAPAPPPDAQTTPPPPPGGAGGEVPTAGGAGGAPPPPTTGPPPPPGGRPRHADAPAEPAPPEAATPRTPSAPPEPGSPGTGPLAGVRAPGDAPTPPSAEPEAASSEVASGPSEVGAPPTPAPPPPEPEPPAEPQPRTGSVPPPGRPDAARPTPKPATPIGGFSLFFSVLWERIKRSLGRSKQ